MTESDTIARLERERDELLAISREFVAKCMRGNVACTACGACSYMGQVSHNANCPVVRLEAFGRNGGMTNQHKTEVAFWILFIIATFFFARWAVYPAEQQPIRVEIVQPSVGNQASAT